MAHQGLSAEVVVSSAAFLGDKLSFSNKILIYRKFNIFKKD